MSVYLTNNVFFSVYRKNIRVYSTLISVFNIWAYIDRFYSALYHGVLFFYSLGFLHNSVLECWYINLLVLEFCIYKFPSAVVTTDQYRNSVGGYGIPSKAVNTAMPSVLTWIRVLYRVSWMSVLVFLDLSLKFQGYIWMVQNRGQTNEQRRKYFWN